MVENRAPAFVREGAQIPKAPAIPIGQWSAA